MAIHTDVCEPHDHQSFRVTIHHLDHRGDPLYEGFAEGMGYTPYPDNGTSFDPCVGWTEVLLSVPASVEAGNDYALMVEPDHELYVQLGGEYPSAGTIACSAGCRRPRPRRSREPTWAPSRPEG